MSKMARLLGALAILYLGLTPAAVSALPLEVTKDSPCAPVCSGNGAALTTTIKDITCLDGDFGVTTESLRWQNCMSCLQTSSHSSGTQSDLQWFLYNLRYAASYCILGYPQVLNNLTNTTSTAADKASASGAIATPVLPTNVASGPAVLTEARPSAQVLTPDTSAEAEADVDGTSTVDNVAGTRVTKDMAIERTKQTTKQATLTMRKRSTALVNRCSTTDTCGIMAEAFKFGMNGTIDQKYGYCTQNNNAMTGSNYQSCIACVRSGGESNYVANYIVALNTACIQKPEPGKTLDLNGTIFAKTLVIAGPAAGSGTVGGTSGVHGAVVAVIVLFAAGFIGVTVAGACFYRRRAGAIQAELHAQAAAAPGGKGDPFLKELSLRSTLEAKTDHLAQSVRAKAIEHGIPKHWPGHEKRMMQRSQKRQRQLERTGSNLSSLGHGSMVRISVNGSEYPRSNSAYFKQGVAARQRESKNAGAEGSVLDSYLDEMRLEQYEDLPVKPDATYPYESVSVKGIAGAQDNTAGHGGQWSDGEGNVSPTSYPLSRRQVQGLSYHSSIYSTDSDTPVMDDGRVAGVPVPSPPLQHNGWYGGGAGGGLAGLVKGKLGRRPSSWGNSPSPGGAALSRTMSSRYSSNPYSRRSAEQDPIRVEAKARRGI